MRPIRLEMEGFTSFRQTTAVDFSKLDLFAISGATGAGKTSIIDAMIYALYGCTPRIGYKSIKELISQGSDRLKVLLEFSSGRSLYRIARHTKWTGKQSNTDVRLEEKDDEEWIPRADKVTQADPLIEEIVGLDFNGFTKSVVLPQGRFDEFLKGRIDERRKILSDLLQLDIYSRMMQRANEIAKENKNKSETLADLLARDYADATPENLTRVEKELESSTPLLAPVTTELKRVRDLIPTAHHLRQAVNDIAAAEADLKNLGPARVTAEKDRAKAQKLIQAIEIRIKALDARIRASVYNGKLRDELMNKLQKSERLQTVDKRANELEGVLKKKSRQHSELEARHKRAETAYQLTVKTRDLLRKQLNAEKKNLDEAVRKHGSADAIRAAIDINRRRLKDEQKKTKLEKDLVRLTDDQTARAKKLAHINQDLAKAEDALAQSKTQFDLLNQQHAAEELKQLLEKGEPCPVCEQTVKSIPKTQKHPSVDQAKRLVAQREKELKGLVVTKSTLEAGLVELKPQFESKKGEIGETEGAISEATTKLRSVLKKIPGNDVEQELIALSHHILELQATVDETAKKVDESRESEAVAKDDVLEFKRALVGTQAETSSHSEELQRLQDERNTLKTALGRHVDASLLRADLKKQNDAKLDLENNARAKETESQSLSKTKDEVAEASRILEGLKAKGAQLEKHRVKHSDTVTRCKTELASAFPRLKIDAIGPERDAAAQLEQLAWKLQAEREAIQNKLSQLESGIKQLKVLIKRAGEMRKEMEGHRIEGAVAHELAQALRGDQFIAFIQQEAYHRLALDGSRHLKTLSSDRYSFGFDKDEFVVLDHWNADERRPVTTLSGGETFLASLALALALAEGLSGLSHGRGRFALESLFLDEGFGTLDAETLDVVLQGVETLSTTDRLVGIISHIPELADRMPSRIYVRKAVGGSTVEC
jgi:DNA repair protein SbcC/Rad50